MHNLFQVEILEVVSSFENLEGDYLDRGMCNRNHDDLLSSFDLGRESDVSF